MFSETWLESKKFWHFVQGTICYSRLPIAVVYADAFIRDKAID